MKVSAKGILLFIYIAAISGCLATLSSCTSANKLMDKAFAKDSSTVAARCLNAFPNTITESKTDTINTVEFMEVEVPVECDSVIIKDTVLTKIVKTKFVKLPKEIVTKYVTKTITKEDTKKIQIAASEITELKRKLQVKDRFNYALIGMCTVFFLFGLFAWFKKDKK